MKRKIAKLLSQVERKETFEGRDVYFVNEDVFKELWKLRENEINRLIQEGHDESYAKKIALKEYFKLINPKPQPVKITSFGYHASFSLVKDRDKIFNKYNLKKDFYSWANRERKRIKEYIEKNIFDEKEAKKLMDIVEKKIENAKTILNEILKNPDKFEIIRTDIMYRDNIYIPTIYVRFREGHTRPIYLRELVPNIVWELKAPIVNKKRELKILKELEEYENPFHYYYIKKS